MARSKSKKAEPSEVESEPATPEIREEAESFSGVEPAFAELKRTPEIEAISYMALHRRSLDFLEEFRKATVNIVFAAIVGLLVLTFIKVINADELAIDPVTLPKAIKDLGYTEEGVALTLSDNMFKIFNAAQVGQRNFNVKAKIDEGDFAVPVAGLSFSSAIRLTRQIAGFPQRHISGEMLCPSEPCSPTTMELHLRVMDGVHPPHVLEPVKGMAAEAILVAGAEQILYVADPISLAVYLYGDTPQQDARRPEAVAIAKNIIVNNGADKAVALNILGANASNSTGADEASMQKAIGFFLAAIDTDKNYAPSYYNLAVTLFKQGMRQEAIEYFKKAIALNGTVANTHLQLAKDYFELSQYDNAIVEYQKTLALSPNDYDGHSDLAAVYLNTGDYTKAIESANAAISVDPKIASAYYNLGLAYKNLGEKAQALEAFNSYLQRTPDLPENADRRLQAEGNIKLLQ